MPDFNFKNAKNLSPKIRNIVEASVELLMQEVVLDVSKESDEAFAEIMTDGVPLISAYIELLLLIKDKKGLKDEIFGNC